MLKDLAAAQFGVVARRQLVQAGVSERALDRLLARGRLVPLHRSVYAVGHRQLRPEGYRLAAVLACGDGAVLSHRSAAAAWGLLGDSRYRHDVTVPAEKASGRALPGLVVHRAQLAGGDRAERDGVPVTSVARTLVDLAGSGPRRLVARAVDAALVERLYDQYAVDEVLRRGRRLRGTAVLRGVLERRHPDAHRTRSELEAIALERLDDAGLPRPRVNVWLVGLGVEVDLLWGSKRLVVELDGRRYHAHRRPGDVDRDALLEASGYRVRRFGWGDVTAGPFAAEVAAELPQSPRVASYGHMRWVVSIGHRNVVLAMVDEEAVWLGMGGGFGGCGRLSGVRRRGDWRRGRRSRWSRRGWAARRRRSGGCWRRP